MTCLLAMHASRVIVPFLGVVSGSVAVVAFAIVLVGEPLGPSATYEGGEELQRTWSTSDCYIATAATASTTIVTTATSTITTAII